MEREIKISPSQEIHSDVFRCNVYGLRVHIFDDMFGSKSRNPGTMQA